MFSWRLKRETVKTIRKLPKLSTVRTTYDLFNRYSKNLS